MSQQIWSTLNTDIASLASFIALMLAFALLFFQRQWSVTVAVISFALAVYCQRIQLAGVLALVSIGLLYFILQQTRTSLARMLILFVSLGFAYLFKSHILPGFNNWLIINQQVISAGAIPYTLYFNFDKPYFALLIGYFLCNRLDITTHYPKLCLQTLPILISCSVIVCGSALWFKFVNFDFHLSGLTLIWALHNLLIVSISEEIVFREWLQRDLTKLLKRFPASQYWALIIVSGIFGAFHLYGGTTYALLATITGLHYGYALIKTNRVQASILVHFGINLIHFVGFTYPALQ